MITYVLRTYCGRELWSGFFGINENGDQPECTCEFTEEVEEESLERDDDGTVRPCYGVYCPSCKGLLEWPHEWDIIGTMKKDTADGMRGLTLEEHGAILVPDEDGSTHIVHGGEIDPSQVAEVADSQKATIVDWDPVGNDWVSWLRNGKELVRHKDRGEVVRLEHELLAAMIARGEKIPDDNLRSALAWHCRRWWGRIINTTCLKKLRGLLRPHTKKKHGRQPSKH